MGIDSRFGTGPGNFFEQLGNIRFVLGQKVTFKSQMLEQLQVLFTIEGVLAFIRVNDQLVSFHSGTQIQTQDDLL
ncbi:hypothetical protein D3C76_945960 [compost metagenome]